MWEVERLRSSARRQQKRLKHAQNAASQANVLLGLLDEAYTARSVGQLGSRVARICRETTGADVAFVLLADNEGDMLTVADTRFGPAGVRWPGAAAPLAVPRNVVDLRAVAWKHAIPPDLHEYRSMLSVPKTLSIGPPLALVLLSAKEASFTRDDRQLVEKIVKLIGPMVEKIRLTMREANAQPGPAKVNGAAPAQPNTYPDATFGSLSVVMNQIQRWQTKIFGITNAILTAASTDIDSKIDAALQLAGQLAEADRSYLFVRRDPERLDNTHEWVAAGIEPMIEHLQDLPDSMLDDWRSDFMSGEEAYIPDVGALPDDYEVKPTLEAQGIKSLLALPLMNEGRLLGFVGFDSVRRHRTFLTYEIQLLQSLADAISIVLVRREAERQAAEHGKALQRQNEVLSAMLVAIPKLILEVGPDGRFVGYNEGSSMPPVYPPDEFIGRLPEEVLPEPAARVWWDAINAVRETGECRDVLLSFEVDGENRDFMIAGGRIALEGSAPGAVFIVREVTEERRRERDRARLSRIAELTHSHVLILGRQGLVEWINPAFANRMDISLECAVGRDCVSLLGVETLDAATASRLRVAVRSGAALHAVLKFKDGRGKSFWAMLDMQPIQSAEGEVEAFVMVQSEVTSLKEAEESALRERAQALEIATDGFAVANRDGRFSFMNAAHRRMFGIDPEEDVSKLSWRDLYSDETEAEISKSVLPDLLKAGHWRGELTGRHRSGAEVPQQLSLSMMDGGQILCATRDISAEIAWNLERARLADTLQTAQRAESIARIASEVAHDLNNMIGVVRGSAAGLKMLCSGDQDAKTGLARIERAIDASMSFVSELRSIEKAPGPKIVQDLRAIVADALVILGTERIRTHHLSSVLPDREQPAHCSSIDVLQVMMNLIWNACESHSRRNANVSIKVLEQPPSGTYASKLMIGDIYPNTPYSAFQVSDDGEGMDAEKMSKIFERYFTTKGERGTGMGMQIVKRMIERNHAALWIQSAEGQGTTVTVAWPAVEIQTPSLPLISEKLGKVTWEDLTGQSVLVVDDYPEAAQTMADSLTDAGAFAMALSSPTEALEIFLACPDVWTAVIVDLDMPGLDGIGFARAVRATPAAPPCILVTARPSEVGTNGRLFDCIVAKPYDELQLVGAVRRAVAREALAE